MSRTSLVGMYDRSTLNIPATVIGRNTELFNLVAYFNDRFKINYW